MAKPRKYAFRGKPFHIPAGIQGKYRDAIVSLTQDMTTEISRDLTNLFKQDAAMQHFAAMSPETVGMDAASPSSQARVLINAAKRKWDSLFGKLALNLSPWMADELNRTSTTQSKSSVKDAPNYKEQSKKLSINVATLDKPTLEMLKASSTRSANFIKTVPDRFINGIADGVYASIATGNGLQDLEPLLEKETNKVANWAHNTAMDQTRKTYNGLNRGRMNKLGISKGEWIHSGGSMHPRELHEAADGETFDLDKGLPVGDDDGNYVLPGDEANCRCTFAPVIEFDDDDDTDTDEDEDK